MKTYYTSEKNTLILISLLKAHGIRKIVASPGATNVSFVASVQQDSFFQVYSAIDERSAAYMACGLAEESGESVVLSCTGATASRNYIPGLTEAFYKHIPVLAVTSTQHTGRVGQYVPQVVDRSQVYKDLVKFSVDLPTVNSFEDEQSTIIKTNNALLELLHGVKGPVHINLATIYSNDFSVKELPNYRVVRRITREDVFPELPNGKIGIFIGAHSVFDKEELDVIDLFCKKNNAIVLCDHTSNYNGKYKVLGNLINNQQDVSVSKKFDLLIHIGYVSGAYIPVSANQVWRVNPDGVVRDLFKKLTYVFEIEEKSFFNYYAVGNDKDDSFINECKKKRDIISSKIPELPFSNIYCASVTVPKLPEGAVLHLGILNSLRSWNFFDSNKVISCYSNTGGFGIDGCVSSMIGAAIANPEKQFYGVFGDLAFFYDINSLLNSIPKNLHIMLINNGIGTEFKNYNHRCAYLGENANDYIAAKGHNGFKSRSLVKDFCENLGIDYLSSTNKTEFLSQIDKWINLKDAAIILEVFTTDKNESIALEIMNNLQTSAKHRFIKLFDGFTKLLKRSIIGKIAKRLLRR